MDVTGICHYEQNNKITIEKLNSRLHGMRMKWVRIILRCVRIREICPSLSTHREHTRVLIHYFPHVIKSYSISLKNARLALHNEPERITYFHSITCILFSFCLPTRKFVIYKKKPFSTQSNCRFRSVISFLSLKRDTLKWQSARKFLAQWLLWNTRKC